jgi:hypothetical protein
VNYFVACICVYPVVVILLAWGNALAGVVGALQKLLAPKQINVPSLTKMHRGGRAGPDQLQISWVQQKAAKAQSWSTTNPSSRIARLRKMHGWVCSMGLLPSPRYMFEPVESPLPLRSGAPLRRTRAKDKCIEFVVCVEWFDTHMSHAPASTQSITALIDQSKQAAESAPVNPTNSPLHKVYVCRMRIIAVC